MEQRSKDGIARQRMRNQGLAGAGMRRAADVVEHLVAVQSQDFAGARWAVGQRMRPGATIADVDAAFAAGEVLRTHVMRPTWHFVASADIRWLLALTAPRVHAANAPVCRRLEIDAPTIRRAERIIVDQLGDGHRTRDELRSALRSAGISVEDGVRLAYLVMHAELEAIICSGPRRGNQFTYAMLDQRAPNARSLTRDAALSELTRRYFASRGPATVHDYAKWSGLTIADAKRGIEGVVDALREEDYGGTRYWTGRARSSGTPSKAVLLSTYDEYISSYRDRSAIVGAVFGKRLIRLGNLLTHVILIDGHVVGTWKPALENRKSPVALTPFRRLTPQETRAVRSAGQRYAEFFGA